GPAQQAGPTKIVRICSRNPATIDRGNRRRIVLLQTLETRDFDELALALPLRNLRFRQLGRGAFRGELQFLKLEGVEVFRVAFNRMVHTQGWPSPDSFACAPVLAANENSVWRGWRLKAGQVRVRVPGQEVNHVTAADHYQLVALVVDRDLLRKGVSVLGGYDLEEGLAGREAVTTSPAFCRALWSHLVGLLDLAQARHDIFTRPGRPIEQECIRRIVGMLAQANDDRTAWRPPHRERLVRRAEDYVLAYLGEPLSVLDLCRELGVSERTLAQAFREVRGLTPMAYFKAVRLNEVRLELKAAPA